MDDNMREFNTDEFESLSDEASRIPEEENQLQELMPEKEARFREQAALRAAEAEASGEDPSESEPSEPGAEYASGEEHAPEVNEAPSEAEASGEEYDPVLNQDTIRLDSLQEVLAMTAVHETEGPDGEQDSVTDETIRLDDSIRDEILEALLGGTEEKAPEPEPEIVNLDNDSDDDDFVTMPVIFLPKQRLRELKRKLVAGPERRYYELAEQGVGKLQLAMLVCFLVIGLSTAAGVIFGMGLIPENRMKLFIFSQVLTMLLGALMGCQQMIEGICELFKGKFTLNTMLLVTFLACCGDAWLCLQELRVPVCAAFTLEVFMCLWSAYHKRTTEMGQMDTMRKATRLDRLTKCEDFYEGKPAFIRAEGQVEDFTDHYDETPRPERIQNIFAVVCLILSLGVAVLAYLRHGLSMGVQIFSTTLLVSIPASFFISITRPMAILERRLHRLGTVLCGWKGIRGLRGKCGFPLYDQDLFPGGAAKMNGVKFYGERDPETVIAYTAALMRINGGNLAPIFDELLISRNGVRYDADNVRFYGNGGIGGEVCGEPVLIGTLEFLKDMGVDIPDGVMVKQAVYVSIDGELSGLFAVTYSRSRNTARGVASICGYRKIIPIVMAEDFMLTAPFLKERFGIRTRRVVFPDRKARAELRAKKPAADSVPLALMTQEGLAPMAMAITGARNLRSAWRLGLIIHILGGVLGLLIMAAIAMTGSTELLTPSNILLYQLIWLVPGFLVTFLTRTI